MTLQNLKNFAIGLTTVSLVACGGGNADSQLQANAESYSGSIFSRLWDTIKSDIYSDRPTKEVKSSDFIVAAVDHANQLLKDSERTIESQEDLLPEFDKLLHPNGTCLKGSWNITETTPYTGYYATGASGLVIARSSVALSDTEQGDYRGFGLAGKIFPTSDEAHTGKLKTGNFFAIDDLAGTKEDYFTRAPLMNKPEISLFQWNLFSVVGLLLEASETLGMADPEPGIRQLYEVGELGVADLATAVTPKWMKIQGVDQFEKIDERDFRDEMDASKYRDGIRLEIYTSNGQERPDGSSSVWKNIGHIKFTETANSWSCDHRLHFHHPKFRK